MKKLLPFLLSATLAGSVLMPATGVFAASEDAVSVQLNGKALSEKGVIVNSRTLVPLRAIVEAAGGQLGWDGATRQVTVVRGTHVVRMTLDEHNLTADGTTLYSDVAPQSVNGRTYLPLRTLAEAVGYDVRWDAATRTAVVSSYNENPVVLLAREQKQQKDLMAISCEYPEVQGLDNLAAQAAINKALAAHATGFAALFSSENWPSDGIHTGYSAESRYHVTWNRNGLLSVVFTDYSYTGGAHGNYTTSGMTFDLRTGEQLTLSDIFNGGSIPWDTLNDAAKKALNTASEYMLADFEGVTPEDCWYLSADGLNIEFQPYQYTAYAVGLVTARIPLDTLNSYALRIGSTPLKTGLASPLSFSLATKRKTTFSSTLNMDVRWPVISGLSDDAGKAVNQALSGYATKFASDWQKEYDAYAAEVQKGAFSHPYQMTVGLSSEVTYASNNLLGIRFMWQTYTGGAHGSWEYKTMLFDTTTGKQLGLFDVLDKADDKALDALIGDALRKTPQADGLSFTSLAEAVPEKDNFWLTPEGLSIFFPHYVIGPYAAGIPQADLPWSSLRRMMTRDLSVSPSGGEFTLWSAPRQQAAGRAMDALLQGGAQPRDLKAWLNGQLMSLSPSLRTDLILKLNKAVRDQQKVFEDRLVYQEPWIQALNNLKDLKKTETLPQDLRILVNDLYANGYRLFPTEGTFNVIPDGTWMDGFTEFADAPARALLAFQRNESLNPPLTDAAFRISWQEILDRLTAAENYLQQWPDSPGAGEMTQAFRTYATGLLIGSNNTPAFDYESHQMNGDLAAIWKALDTSGKDGSFRSAVHAYQTLLVRDHFADTEDVRAERTRLFSVLKLK